MIYTIIKLISNNSTRNNRTVVFSSHLLMINNLRLFTDHNAYPGRTIRPHIQRSDLTKSTHANVSTPAPVIIGRFP